MCAGGPASWHSKMQKCVTLSTTQAEYVAMSDMGKEILFLRQVWCFMLPKARMPCIAMYEDNEGVIQIAKHPICNSNSKHIDLRHHFLRELVREERDRDYPHIDGVPTCRFRHEGVAKEGVCVSPGDSDEFGVISLSDTV